MKQVLQYAAVICIAFIIGILMLITVSTACKCQVTWPWWVVVPTILIIVLTSMYDHYES